MTALTPLDAPIDLSYTLPHTMPQQSPPAAPLVGRAAPPYSDMEAAQLRKWMPPGVDAEPLSLFRALVKVPALMGAMLPLGAYFLGPKNPLPLRLRELILLRSCALAGCDYEWGVHVAGFAPKVGLGDDDLSDLYHKGPSAERWTDAERAALSATDEATATGRLSDATIGMLCRHFNEAERMTIATLAMWYQLISVVANSCCQAGEPWAPGFPGD